MQNVFKTYHPEGFSTVNPYLFVEKPEELIAFLTEVFYAEELSRTINPQDGTIQNIVLKIGYSSIMLSQAQEPFLGMRTCFYFYVNAVDAIYNRAPERGASSVFPPPDMPYGDRQGGIQDPAGNYWWISERLEEKGYG